MSPKLTKHEQISLPLVNGYNVLQGEWPEVWGEAPAGYLAELEKPEEERGESLGYSGVDAARINKNCWYLKYAPPWALVNHSPLYNHFSSGTVGLVVPEVFATCKLEICALDNGAESSIDSLEAGEVRANDDDWDIWFYDARPNRNDGYALWWVCAFGNEYSKPLRIWPATGETLTGTEREKVEALYEMDCRVKATWWTED